MEAIATTAIMATSLAVLSSASSSSSSSLSAHSLTPQSSSAFPTSSSDAFPTAQDNGDDDYHKVVQSAASTDSTFAASSTLAWEVGYSSEKSGWVSLYFNPIHRLVARAGDPPPPPPPPSGSHGPPMSNPKWPGQGVINLNGFFNGSCASSVQQNTPLDTPPGSCSSYFPDITAYCCNGIGGNLSQINWELDTQQNRTGQHDGEGSQSTSQQSYSGNGDGSSAIDEPICTTSQYADALACFKLTAETNCISGGSGLYGVCSVIENDTSTYAASVSSWQRSAASSKTLHGGGTTFVTLRNLLVGSLVLVVAVQTIV